MVDGVRAECGKFQSTLSVRRATFSVEAVFGGKGISIHALRKESDMDAWWNAATEDISIHALRKESDLSSLYFPLTVAYFNPRSP